MDPKKKLSKLLRTAKFNDQVSRDESVPAHTRALAATKRNAAEEEAFRLIYDPFAVTNAALEAERAKKLLARKSTNESNREERELAARVAERNFQALASQMDTLESQARTVIDVWMGRKKVEDLQKEG